METVALARPVALPPSAPPPPPTTAASKENAYVALGCSAPAFTVRKALFAGGAGDTAEASERLSGGPAVCIHSVRRGAAAPSGAEVVAEALATKVIDLLELTCEDGLMREGGSEGRRNGWRRKKLTDNRHRTTNRHLDM